MRNQFVFILALVILAVLMFYPISYQVRFNETVVVTTFGRAEDGSVKNADPGKDESGLYWKWPWPIQDVQTYDKRVQVLEDRLEEQQTLDKKGVVVNAYVSWRIVDPLAFYRALRDVATAENQIRARLRDARSVLGRFTMDDLTNTDPAQLRLAEAENAILQKLRADLEHGSKQQSLGIVFESVGIKRIILPQAVTEAVFAHMRATRERLAQAAKSSGDAQASDIKAKANAARQTILSFAERRAQSLRAQGDAAVQQYYGVFKQDENFAIFLRKMKTYRDVLKNNSTFLIDAREGLFNEFLNPPGQGNTGLTPLDPSRAPAGVSPLAPAPGTPGNAPAPAPGSAPGNAPASR